MTDVDNEEGATRHLHLHLPQTPAYLVHLIYPNVSRSVAFYLDFIHTPTYLTLFPPNLLHSSVTLLLLLHLLRIRSSDPVDESSESAPQLTYLQGQQTLKPKQQSSYSYIPTSPVIAPPTSRAILRQYTRVVLSQSRTPSRDFTTPVPYL